MMDADNDIYVDWDSIIREDEISDAKAEGKYIKDFVYHYYVVYYDTKNNRRFVCDPSKNGGYCSTLLKPSAYKFSSKDDALNYAKKLKYGQPRVLCEQYRREKIFDSETLTLKSSQYIK